MAILFGDYVIVGGSGGNTGIYFHRLGRIGCLDIDDCHHGWKRHGDNNNDLHRTAAQGDASLGGCGNEPIGDTQNVEVIECSPTSGHLSTIGL